MKKKFIASAIIMAVSLALFIVLAAIVYNYECNPLKSFRETPGIDASVRDYFYNTRGEKYGFAFWFCRIFTEFGGVYFGVILAIVVLLYTRFDYRFVVFVLGLGTELVLNFIFKHSFDRLRPFTEAERWMVDETASFPSGHSSLTGYVWTIITYFIWLSDEKKLTKIIVTCVSAFFFVLVPFTRLVLEMHYFTDVIAGLSLGVFTAGGTILVATLCENFNLLQKPLIKFKKKNKQVEESNE